MPQQQSAAATSEPKRALDHKHTTHYLHTCKACVEADKARSAIDKRGLTDAQLAHTTFLLPEMQYENQVCRAYLTQKYPDVEPQNITASLNLSMLTGWEKDDLIVVVRRVPGPKGLGPMVKRGKDAEDKWDDIYIPASEYIHEVVESAPLVVDELVVRSKANRFVAAKVDHVPLIDRLTELLVPTYRVDMPRHKDDCIMRIIRG